MNDPRDQNRFIIRMPEGLRERIAETARVNGRSMNAEIVRTLEEQYPDILPEARKRYRAIYALAEKATGIDKNEFLRALDEYLTYMATYADLDAIEEAKTSD